MVELIRKIIPQTICGGNEFKLRRMDSMVHAFYEVAGTGGAFFSLFLILNMGSVYANFFVPPFWMIAGFLWGMIKLEKISNKAEEGEGKEGKSEKSDGLIKAFFYLIKGFFFSIFEGAQIVFSSRQFSWLFLGYSIPLVLHRYLESQLAPAFAKHILKTTAYSQIMVGGSNSGELIGAVFVVMKFFSIIKIFLNSFYSL